MKTEIVLPRLKRVEELLKQARTELVELPPLPQNLDLEARQALTTAVVKLAIAEKMLAATA